MKKIKKRCQHCYSEVSKCNCGVGKTMQLVHFCSNCDKEMEEPIIFGGEICNCKKITIHYEFSSFYFPIKESDERITEIS